MIRVCLHGAESTGKSVLARKLESRFGWPWVPEYGREWAEANGTDFSLASLLAIAEGQDRAMRAAAAARPRVLMLDTDPLMTAAWAQMLFGAVPDALFAYEKAELYLLFSPEVPWVEDGTRMFGTPDARAAFARVAEDMLVRAGVPFVRIGGDWAEREARTVAAIENATGAGLTSGPETSLP